MITRRAFVSGVVTAPALLGLQTGGSSSALRRGREIVDKTIDALGGDAFRDMETRVEIGRAYSFYHEQLSGLSIARLYTKYLPVNRDQKSPELYVDERQVFGKKQDDAVILTPKDGYEVTFRGAKPLTEDRLSQFRESTLHDILYILHQRRDEAGLDFEAQGKDVVENQPVEIVQIYDSENRQVKVWINSDTWLPVKQQYTRRDPITNDPRDEVTRYSRYQPAGHGVVWPHSTQRERDTEQIFVFYANEVHADQPLADGLFELPHGIKMLK
jgi:hypothetical protein